MRKHLENKTHWKVRRAKAGAAERWKLVKELAEEIQKQLGITAPNVKVERPRT